MTGLLAAVALVAAVAAASIGGLGAWRSTRETKRRSEMRVTRLAEAIDAADPRPATRIRVSHLLEGAGPADGGSRRSAILAATIAAAVLLVSALGTLATPRASERNETPRADAARTTPGSAATLDRAVDLELLALSDERGPDRELRLRGVVRKPSGAGAVSGVTAVAALFDRQGAFLASGRVAIPDPALASGERVPFVVTVPDAAAAVRYRVSFRIGDSVVPHLDRRNTLHARAE